LACSASARLSPKSDGTVGIWLQRPSRHTRRHKARHAQNKAGKRWREDRTTVRNVQTATERRRLDARSVSLPRQRDRSGSTWKTATTQPALATRLILQKTTMDKDPSPYRCRERAFSIAATQPAHVR